MKGNLRFPERNPSSFPFKAGRGNSIITIYRTTSNGYDEFKLPFNDCGKRRFHRFSNYEAARDKGNEMLNQLSCGHGEAITLTGSDRHSFIQAREAVKPFGVPLEIAALQFAEAMTILEGVSVIEVIRAPLLPSDIHHRNAKNYRRRS